MLQVHTKPQHTAADCDELVPEGEAVAHANEDDIHDEAVLVQDGAASAAA